MELKLLQKSIHNNAVEKGFYDSPRSIPETLCLIHSEVSEALEAYRNDNWINFKEELADIVIRVLDTCEYHAIDLMEEILKKHDYNKSRPYKHGNKKC